MRPFLEEYGIVLGLLILATTAIVLFSTPEDIFRNSSIVDTELYYKTNNEVYVQNTFNFYDVKTLKEFPKNFGGWSGIDNVSEEQKAINFYKTETLLLRKYYNGERSIQFILIKSENETDAHHPIYCYGRAWNVTETGIETVKPANWSGEIYVSKLSAQKENRRDVAVYWYMRGAGLQRSVKNTVVIMISTPVYFNETNESYALNTLKDFASEIIPVMYNPRERSDIIGKQLIDKFGIFGILTEVLVVGLSFILIFYGRLFKKR